MEPQFFLFVVQRRIQQIPTVARVLVRTPPNINLGAPGQWEPVPWVVSPVPGKYHLTPGWSHLDDLGWSHRPLLFSAVPLCLICPMTGLTYFLCFTCVVLEDE